MARGAEVVEYLAAALWSAGWRLGFSDDGLGRWIERGASGHHHCDDGEGLGDMDGSGHVCIDRGMGGIGRARGPARTG